jgi:dihydroflavonol-4-reductase
MNIAVTGANGHVGINLCRTLLEQGHRVKALAHTHDANLKCINVEIIRGDLLQKETLHPFVQNTDVVFHLAAKISIKGDPDLSVRNINVEGTRNILEAAMEHDIQRFIHFSSIHAIQHEPLNQVLDETRGLVREEAFSYDRSKADGERLVMAAARDGFNAIVLCPTAIMGPEDPEPSLSGKAMLELYNRQIPALVPGGYNWVDVRDIVQAGIAAITKGRKGEKYLLSGKWYSLKEMSELIRKITGANTTSLVIPFWIAHAGLPFIALYSWIMGVEPVYTSESLHIIKTGSKHISCEKAKNELDFNPRSLEATLTDLFDWFKENKMIN